MGEQTKYIWEQKEQTDNILQFLLTTKAGSFECSAERVIRNGESSFNCKYRLMGCEPDKAYPLCSGEFRLWYDGHLGLYMKHHPKAPASSLQFLELVDYFKASILISI